jgi:predicted HAD superfamily Cof-like phosphohydrolase
MTDNLIYEQVREFHKTFGAKIGTEPSLMSFEEQNLRIALMEEELQEYVKALQDGDMVTAYDSLLDLLYVTVGSLISHGFPLQEGFDEVHRANMTKRNIDGTVSYREDGKVIKPPTFTPPNLERILNESTSRDSG